MADYQQAQEMASDDHSIWVRLAVIHNTRGILLYQERSASHSHTHTLTLTLTHTPLVTRSG